MSIAQTPTDDTLVQSMLTEESPFRNKLLIAMPSLRESFFSKSVVYVCAHGGAGAMGIVINQQLPDVAFGDLLSQLSIPAARAAEPVVHFGGPVETGRGFVLHTMDFMRADTVRIDDSLCITGTVDILQALAEGRGPARSLFALGYAGWGPGQLEAELQAGSWLTADADDSLVFSPDLPQKWENALASLGVSPLALSAECGRA